MIAKRVLLANASSKGSDPIITWTIEAVPTKAEDNAFKFSVPIVFLPDDTEADGKELTIDWGDKTSTTITKDDFGNLPIFLSMPAIIHTYSSDNQVIVTITGKQSAWNNAYWLDNPYAVSQDEPASTFTHFYLWRNSVVTFSPVPPFKGCYEENTNTTPPTFIKYDNYIRYLCYGCTRITKTPSKVFSLCPEVENIEGAFCNCPNLTTVTADTFHEMPSLLTAGNAFSYCSKLASLPSGGIFKDSPLLNRITSICAYNTALTAIPEDIFSANPDLQNIQSAFENCTALPTIPAELFLNKPNLRIVDRVFMGCSGFINLPTPIFDNASKITTMQDVFASCTSLEFLPDGLFGALSNLKTTQRLFKGCSAVSAVPAIIFQSAPKLKTIFAMFQGCSNLNTMRSVDVFKAFTALDDVQNLFFDCTRATTFKIRFTAADITSANNLFSLNTYASRQVYCPANSTSYNTFRALPSTMSVSVTGE